MLCAVDLAGLELGPADEGRARLARVGALVQAHLLLVLETLHFVEEVASEGDVEVVLQACQDLSENGDPLPEEQRKCRIRKV